MLDKALALADWQGFARRRAVSERRGKRRGIGLALHCQRAGSQSERMEIRVAQDGSLALHAGTLSTGQGHETAFAQMAAEWFGVPHGKVRLIQGDTGKVLHGRGTYAQRSMNAGGSALRLAADEVILKGKRVAGELLEADAADIEFEAGAFRVKGTDRLLSLAEIPRTKTPTNDFLVALNQKLQRDIGYLVRMEPGVQTCEQTLDLKYEDESGKWSRTFAFDELRDPRKLLEEFGSPLPLTLARLALPRLACSMIEVVNTALLRLAPIKFAVLRNTMLRLVPCRSRPAPPRFRICQTRRDLESITVVASINVS